MDHIKGLPVLLKHTDMPVYTTEETWRAIRKYAAAGDNRFVSLTKRVGVGAVRVVPFEIPHDAARPVGYAVYYGDTKITYATDLGTVTPAVEGAAAHADILIWKRTMMRAWFAADRIRITCSNAFSDTGAIYPIGPRRSFCPTCRKRK